MVVGGGQNVSVRCVQDGEGGRSCGGCGRSECECEVCVGRRGRQWLLSVVDVVVGGQMVSVSAVCRMERQAGVVVGGREQIVSALCVQSGEAGRGGCGWERTDCE